MSRRKFGSALIASSLLVFSAVTVTTLSSCGGPEKQEVVESKITEVAINNKTDLTKEWHAGQDNRKVGIAAKEGEKEINVQNALASGEITITSSNEAVVAVSGLYLQAKAEGKATITVAVRGKADVKDTIEIDVKEALVKATTVAEIHKNLEPGLKKKDAESTYEYIVEGKVISADKDSYCTVNDGTGLITVFGGKDVKTVSVGDVVKVTGKLSNYWGAIQFKFPTITKSTKTVGELKATKYDAAKFEAYKAFQGKNDTELKDGAVKPEFVEAALVYKGKTDKTVDFQIKDSQLMVNVAKSDPAVLAEIDKLTVGNTYTVTGSLLGWNGGHNYFNITANTAVLAEEGKPVESVTVTADKTTLKIGEVATLTGVKNPVDAAGNMEYAIKTGDCITIEGNKITGTKAGTATVIAKVGTIESAPITITVTNEQIGTVGLEEVYKAKKDDVVYFHAIYVGQFDKSTKNGLYFGDGEYGIMIYGQMTLPEGLVAGKHCKIKGTVDVYNGGFQIKNAEIEIVDKTDAKAPVALEITTLVGIPASKLVARQVKAVGKVEADPKIEDKDYKGEKYKVVSFKVVLANGEKVSVRVDDRYSEIDSLITLKANQDVTIEGVGAYFVSKANELPADNKGFQIVNAKNVGEVVEVPATAITLASDKASIKINEEAKLTATLTPENATTKVTYEVKTGAEFVTLTENTVTGKAAGVATIVAKAGDKVSNEVTITVTAEVNDPFATAEAISIKDLNAVDLTTCGIKEGKKLYKVTGVVDAAEDTKYGAFTLTDRTTGDSLTTYGFSGDKTSIGFTNNAYKLKNPQNFNTDVLGKLINLGDEVEIYVYKYRVWDGDKRGSYEGALSKVVSAKDTIDYELKNVPAELTASKTTGLKHGEVVTLTPSTAIPADKEIKSVKHSGFEVDAEADGTYKINIKAYNTLEVTLKNKGEVENSVTITATDLGLASYSNVDTTVNAGGLTFVHKKLMKGEGNSIQFKKDEGYIYLSAPTDLAIASVEVTASKDWTSTATLVCKFGTEKVTTAEKTKDALAAVDLTANEVKPLNSGVTNAKYFALCAYDHAINLTSIKINFIVA